MSSDSGSWSSNSSEESSYSTVLQHLNRYPPHRYASAGRTSLESARERSRVPYENRQSHGQGFRAMMHGGFYEYDGRHQHRDPQGSRQRRPAPGLEVSTSPRQGVMGAVDGGRVPLYEEQRPAQGLTRGAAPSDEVQRPPGSWVSEEDHEEHRRDRVLGGPPQGVERRAGRPTQNLTSADYAPTVSAADGDPTSPNSSRRVRRRAIGEVSSGYTYSPPVVQTLPYPFHSQSTADRLGA